MGESGTIANIGGLVCEDAAPALGIDFGGTKIEAVLLSKNGAAAWRQRIPNPGSYDSALTAISNLVAAADDAGGARCTVGIGAPGSPSPRTGIMRNSNSTYLNGRPFREDLARALGRPVRLVNDANCLALSEAIDGAAAGAQSVFALVIGTGVGGGVVLSGAAIDGAHGIAGEIGHLPLPWPADARPILRHAGAGCRAASRAGFRVPALRGPRPPNTGWRSARLTSLPRRAPATPRPAPRWMPMSIASGVCSRSSSTCSTPR